MRQLVCSGAIIPTSLVAVKIEYMEPAVLGIAYLGTILVDFSSKRTALDTILRMSDGDTGFSRIAPAFLDRSPRSNEFGRSYSYSDPAAGLPKARWDAYRQIYKADGIALGIERDNAGDAFIMVGSVGLLNRGHVTGYLHCRASASRDAGRFHPCLLNQDNGGHKFSADPREEAYSFQRIEGGWFAYDEGPS